MEKSALILVDIQNDFLPGGALAVNHGDQVIPIANQLIPRFEHVIATQDWHPADHMSFASQHSDRAIGDMIHLDGLDQVLWPDHCVQYSDGAAFADALDTASIQQVFRKGMNPRIDSYSGFFDNGHRAATGMSDWLKNANITKVYIAGLATDYCVKFTALDARQLGLETHLVLEGCRGVELQPGDNEKAIEEMRQAGVAIVQSHTLF